MNVYSLLYDQQQKNKQQSKMEDSQNTWRTLSNKQLQLITKYRGRIRQMQEQTIYNNILNKDTNNLQFYKITPREELPKYLQKMKFQTLHFKEKDIANSVKIFKKQNRKPLEHQLRNKLKTQGHLMLLSQIYQFLGQPGGPSKKTILQTNPTEMVDDLDQWQKLKKQEKQTTTNNIFTKRNVQMQVSQLISKQNRKNSIDVGSKLFQKGSDFKVQIQKALGIIEMTHSSEYNQMNRYVLVQNSSKILKKQLDQKKSILQQTIKNKMKLLHQARFEYHNTFQQKNQLHLQERYLNDDHFRQDKDTLKISHKSIPIIKLQKQNEHKLQKKWLIQANQSKILKIKKNIQNLEQSISSLEEQLTKIMVAQKLYFKISLKNGNDVRETGLVWIIKKLQIREDDLSHYQFPVFLDKKCKLFLIQKAQTEQEEDQLLEEKRKFVNEIGRSTNQNKKYKNLLSPKELLNNDRIIQNDIPYQPVPKKYRKSIRKISQLNEQYQKNSSLLQHQRDKNKLIQISADLDGLSNKQIYSQIGQRIKNLDLSKLKKDKICNKKLRLLQYQTLLQKIKNIHIKLQDMDLQLEHHLLSHYKDNRNLYFMQAAACFGYKRAYTMIIKHFSWKNYQENQH